MTAIATSGRKPLRAPLAILAVLLVAFLLVNHYRTIGWRDIISPAYWARVRSGENLYQPEAAALWHGNPALPEVALTFDDGPHPESRAQILNVLKSHSVKATFFDVGKNVSDHPDLVRRTLAEGHEIANHSMYHNRLDSLTPEKRHREINDADIAFYAIAQQHLKYLRPPGMRFNRDVLNENRRLGYVLIGYNVASRDSEVEQSSGSISAKTMERVENGSIVLLHDYPNTAQALPAILDSLQKRGLRCVTISEMLAHLPDKQRNAVQEYITTGAK